jgi:Flp pilus assembly protein TadG
VLIIFALSTVVIFGFMGFAFDLGRLFIARNEAQAFCDAAALAAASLLDGTSGGITKATNAVAGTYATSTWTSTGPWKKYAFGTGTFTTANTTVQFSTDNSTWVTGPGTGANYSFVKVTATPQVALYLSRIVTGTSQGTAKASAVGAQVLKTTFDEGMLPLDMMAHCTQPGTANTYGFTTCPCAQPGTGATANVCTTQPDIQALGLATGRTYTLEWPNGPFNGKTVASTVVGWCKADGDTDANSPNTYNSTFQAGLLNEKPNSNGFWSSVGLAGNTSTYRALLAGMMGVTVGGLLNFGTSPSQKQTIATALGTRSANLATSFGYAPIIDPVSMQVVGVREVQLIKGNYQTIKNQATPTYTGLSYATSSGSDAWCANFVGAAVWGTGGTAVGAAGVYEVRLVQ